MRAITPGSRASRRRWRGRSSPSSISAGRNESSMSAAATARSRRRIAGRVPRGSVLGVDPSHDMIAFATGHFPPSVRPNLRFEVADARRLPYRREFDLVVSFNALHWVPEQEDALRSIRSALRPGGRAILRFVPQGERTSLEDVIEDVRESAGWAEFFRGFRTTLHASHRRRLSRPGRAERSPRGRHPRPG